MKQFVKIGLEMQLDPDMVHFARLSYRMGFCKEVICNLLGFTGQQFDRMTRDCKQGDKEYLLDRFEV